MKTIFRRGYIVYSTPGDVTYVAPHAGPALEIPTSRDENTETVSSLCWFKTGGKLIISSLPRKRALGIDFNRGIPPRKKAIEMFERFISDDDNKEMFEYRKKYAWSAFDDADYEKRLSIYRSFWNEAKNGNFIILVHRCFSRLKNAPTLMDFTTFDGKGINKGLLQKAIDEVNNKNKSFFRDIEKAYKAVILLDEERAIKNLLRVYGDFSLEKIESDFAENLSSDLKMIEKHVSADVYKELLDNFTPKNFLRASKKALVEMSSPNITLEYVFKGDKSIGPRKQLLSPTRTALNVESTAFMNFWYPHKAAEIIQEITDFVRKEL